MKPPFYRCAACRHDFTVTAGTLFADTRFVFRFQRDVKFTVFS